MNFFQKLEHACRRNRSLVCAGLDPAFEKLPECVRGSSTPFLDFNRAIIDATRDWVACYKPQAAFYAGDDRDDELRETIAYIRERAPEIPVILDVKRGDIGSTAAQYAREAFERYDADAVTVNPYMGVDAVKPFLDHADKGVFVLCRNSNPGAVDLQDFSDGSGKRLFEHVAELVRDRWNCNHNAGLVVGATYPDELRRLREMCPELVFLVPGVGAQGGDLEKVIRYGCSPAAPCGVLVNSSRGIIFAGHGDDFAAAAGNAARELRDQINSYR